MLLALLTGGSVLFALAGGLPELLVGALLAGFGYLTSQTRTTTLLYRTISDHERGRVMALWTMAFIGTRPLASLVDGLIGSTAGVRVAALAMVLPAASACVLSACLDRRRERGVP